MYYAGFMHFLNNTVSESADRYMSLAFCLQLGAFLLMATHTFDVMWMEPANWSRPMLRLPLFIMFVISSLLFLAGFGCFIWSLNLTLSNNALFLLIPLLSTVLAFLLIGCVWLEELVCTKKK
jgi:hypothetical protein